MLFALFYILVSYTTLKQISVPWRVSLKNGETAYPWRASGFTPRLLMGLLFCLVYVCFACLRTVCFVFELYVACPMDCPFLIPRFLIGSVMLNLLVFCFVLCIFVCLHTACCVPNGLSFLDCTFEFL